jgi:outer membrane protein
MSKGINTVILSFLVFAVAILYFLHFRTDNEYVFIDAQKLVNGYKGMQVARKQYESKVSVWQANLDTLRLETESKIVEYEKKGKTMSARERELMEELINTKKSQYLEYQKAISENIQKEDQLLTSNVLEKVNAFIKQYGKEHGYTIILAATQYGNIAYAKEGIDITDDLLKELNGTSD